MTDKEMAEEYAKGLCKTCKVDVCRHSRIQTCAIKQSLKQAHLAGLKAGKDMAEADLANVAYMQGAERYKPKWHKVADGDYPHCEKGNYTINVLTDCGDIAYYNYDEEAYAKNSIVPFGWVEDNNRAIPSKEEVFTKVQTEEQRDFLLEKLNNKYTKHLRGKYV